MNDEELLKLNLVHAIHTTERKSFRSCRRRWNWVFKEFYYPLVTPRPLEFGVAYHAAMEKWYAPELWTHPDHDEVAGALALTEFHKVTKDQLASYRKLNGEPDEETLADYQDRVDLGLKMVKYYTTKVSPVLDKDFTPLGVEVPFEVPLGFRCKCDICFNRYAKHFKIERPFESLIGRFEGLPVTYGGRVDMIAIDKHDRLWITDWKTTTRILDEGKEESFLELEDQISSYVVAFHKLGRPVAGFIYHEQKKAVPEEPKLLLRKMKGRSYSTAQNQNTSYNIFYKKIFEEDRVALEEGAYDEYLQWLRLEGPRFHQRHQVSRNATQIANAWDDMVAEAHDIIDNPRVYPQPGRFSCNTCAYRQPCLGQNMGEDYQYTLKTLFEKRDRHYFEEPATTDSNND